MKRTPWIAVPLALTLAVVAHAAGGAHAAEAVAMPRAAGYDIHSSTIPAYETCGHWATNNGVGVWTLDWAVNGTVVAEDAEAINYTNNGSPYTVSIGQVSGGVFSAYYSETFYPVHSGNTRACLIW